jgi:Protein of unknown function (DUF2846)
MKCVIRLIAASGLLACTISMAQQTEVSQTPPASGARTSQLRAAAQTSGKPATIVFYRRSSFYGKALRPSIFLDGNEIGRLKNGRYLSCQTTTGKHLLASSKKDTAVEVTLTEEQPQYVEMLIQNGTWRGAGRLVPVPAEEGKRKADELKPAED